MFRTLLTTLVVIASPLLSQERIGLKMSPLEQAGGIYHLLLSESSTQDSLGLEHLLASFTSKTSPIAIGPKKPMSPSDFELLPPIDISRHETLLPFGRVFVTAWIGADLLIYSGVKGRSIQVYGSEEDPWWPKFRHQKNGGIFVFDKFEHIPVGAASWTIFRASGDSPWKAHLWNGIFWALHELMDSIVYTEAGLLGGGPKGRISIGDWTYSVVIGGGLAHGLEIVGKKIFSKPKGKEKFPEELRRELYTSKKH